MKTCKYSQCGKEFKPFNSTQQVCPGSIECALGYAEEKKKKRFKTETRKMRREFNLKDRSYQMKKAQEAFNAYIRQRDAGNGCISCQGSSGAKVNAGHYLTVGAHPELRFDEDNCHLQCEWCNSFLSGNIARYRINLIDKIGLNRVERLEGPHDPKHYTLDEIIEIKNLYRSKLKALREAV